MSRGTSFGTPTEGEVELAEEIVDRVGPVEQVRLVSSGTEATMSAIRLARGFTGRTKVVKFAGCYHGHVDSLLAAAGSGRRDPRPAGHPRRDRGVAGRHGRRPLQRPGRGGRGVPPCTTAQIACVITEAAAGNMGVVPPAPGFNAGLAELCRDNGALFVSDEVMTGFRVQPGRLVRPRGRPARPDDVRQGDGWRASRPRRSAAGPT